MPGKKKILGKTVSKKKRKPVKMTAAHKAAGKKYMAKGNRPGTRRVKKKI